MKKVLGLALAIEMLSVGVASAIPLSDPEYAKLAAASYCNGNEPVITVKGDSVAVSINGLQSTGFGVDYIVTCYSGASGDPVVYCLWPKKFIGPSFNVVVDNNKKWAQLDSYGGSPLGVSSITKLRFPNCYN